MMDHRNLLAAGRTLAPAFAALALVGLALAASGLAACQRQAQDASAIPHTPIPKAEPRLSIAAEDGRLVYEGVVADAATRDAIVRALGSAAPEADGTLAVEAMTKPAAWARALGPAAAALRGTGGRLGFAGQRIELGGRLTQEQRATLSRRIGRLYPGYELVGAFQGADPNQALPDEGDPDALLAFLNARPIEFQSGAGMLTAPGLEALARAARGLQAAGAAARVEIRVLPEPGGDAADQHAIARQRADAILTQLALRGVAPGRLRAVVAQAPAAKGARIVEFAPFPPDAAGASAAPPADSAALDGAAEAPAEEAASAADPPAPAD